MHKNTILLEIGNKFEYKQYSMYSGIQPYF